VLGGLDNCTYQNALVWVITFSVCKSFDAARRTGGTRTKPHSYGGDGGEQTDYSRLSQMPYADPAQYSGAAAGADGKAASPDTSALPGAAPLPSGPAPTTSAAGSAPPPTGAPPAHMQMAYAGLPPGMAPNQVRAVIEREAHLACCFVACQAVCRYGARQTCSHHSVRFQCV
jgi:hypothetical protein